MSLLRECGVRPSSRMGQSFLLDVSILRAVARPLIPLHAGAKEGLVIEVGSGPGNLTEVLLEQGFNVIAVERDRRLGRLCRRRLLGARFALILADILKFPFKMPAGGRVISMAGNIPYSITGEILRLLNFEMGFIEAASIVVQEEVAERILSGPGRREYGALTLHVGSRWKVERGVRIPAEKFFPRPGVNSRHVFLSRRREPAFERDLEPVFKRVVAGSFSYRRKKIKRALALALRGEGAGREDALRICRLAGIDPDLRPENLSLDDFVRIARAVDILHFPKVQ